MWKWQEALEKADPELKRSIMKGRCADLSRSFQTAVLEINCLDGIPLRCDESSQEIAGLNMPGMRARFLQRIVRNVSLTPLVPNLLFENARVVESLFHRSSV